MQIIELLRLTKWFQQKIVDEKIPNYYQNLFKKLNQNAQAVNNQPKQPFEDDKKNLFTSLRQVTLNTLTLEQIGFLQELEVLDLLGDDGIKTIETVLYENSLDIATAAQKIGVFNNTIKNAVAILNELDTTLSKSFSINDEDRLFEDSVIMRVYFQAGVAINNVTDLKKLSATWYEIGRGIAMAQGRTPEDFKIIGAEKGSLVIEMAVITGIAASVSTILLQALKVAERVIEILKKAEELKALNLSNSRIEQDLRKEAKEVKDNGIKSILDVSRKEFGFSEGDDGDKLVALEKSITKLIDFTEKGGAVDFVEPDDATAENGGEEQNTKDLRSETAKLKGNVQEIRQLENRIKQLEIKIEDHESRSL